MALIDKIKFWKKEPELDLDELDKICEGHKIKYGFKPIVVEDCAHAFGAGRSPAPSPRRCGTRPRAGPHRKRAGRGARRAR